MISVPLRLWDLSTPSHPPQIPVDQHTAQKSPNHVAYRPNYHDDDTEQQCGGAEQWVLENRSGTTEAGWIGRYIKKKNRLYFIYKIVWPIYPICLATYLFACVDFGNRGGRPHRVPLWWRLEGVHARSLLHADGGYLFDMHHVSAAGLCSVLEHRRPHLEDDVCELKRCRF